MVRLLTKIPKQAKGKMSFQKEILEEPNIYIGQKIWMYALYQELISHGSKHKQLNIKTATIKLFEKIHQIIYSSIG